MEKLKKRLANALQRSGPHNKRSHQKYSTVEQNSVLLSIPVDLLVEHVLSRLSLRTLTACLSVCSQLRTTITSSMQLTYIMGLEKEGMADNPSCSYDIYPRIKRLEMLREHARRWKHLDVKWRTRIHWPVVGQELDGISFTPQGQMLMLPWQNDWERNQVKEAYLTHLPDTLDAPVTWENIRIDNHILGVGMAIEEHNLLACATSMPSPIHAILTSIQIHLLCRSRHEPHPLALSPVLDICTIGVARPDSLSVDNIYVSGENLAFIVTYDDASGQQCFLNIWNWKTGVRKADLTRSFDGGASFLREDLLVVPDNLDRQTSLDIFYIPPSSETSYRHGASTRIGAVRPIQSLLLPHLAEDADMTNITCVTKSTPTDPTFSPHADPSRPFVSDPLSAILVFTLSAYISAIPTGFAEDFTFVVPRTTLLDYALDALITSPDPGETHGQGDYKPSVVPWELWGPQATRWFPRNYTSSHDQTFESFTDFVTSSGTRCVSYDVQYQHDPRVEVLQVQVFNFGLPALLQSPSDARKSSYLIAKAFAKPVISYLPCAVVDLPWTIAERDDVGQDVPLNLFTARSDWSKLKIDEERIVCELTEHRGVEVLYFG